LTAAQIVAEKGNARVARVACPVCCAVIPQGGKPHNHREMAMMEELPVMRRVDATQFVKV
jgi:hypothetical protein